MIPDFSEFEGSKRRSVSSDEKAHKRFKRERNRFLTLVSLVPLFGALVFGVSAGDITRSSMPDNAFGYFKLSKEIKTMKLNFGATSEFTKVEYYFKGSNYVRYVRSYKLGRIRDYASDYEIMPEDLLAMCLTEGFLVEKGLVYGCRNEAIGDGGRSYGAFQIQRMNMPPADAQNFDKAIVWTAERMNRKGYDIDSEFGRRKAMSAHNGGGEMAYQYGLNKLIISPQLSKYF